jgi:predicted small lipoprotein YifL
VIQGFYIAKQGNTLGALVHSTLRELLMKIRFTGLLLFTSLFLLTACGQKGPLYLEKATAPATKESKIEKDASTEKTESEESKDK